MLDKQVFVDSAVGEYFNKNYVSVKIDAEKGDGIELAREYGVKAYPTLVFLDKNGNFLYKKSGAPQPIKLIEWAQEQVIDNSELNKYNELFAAGKLKKRDDLAKYIEIRKKAELSPAAALPAYVKSHKKKERYSKEIYDLILECGTEYGGYGLDFIIKNRDKFIKSGVSVDRIDNLIYSRLIFKAYRVNGSEEYFAEIEKLDWDFIKYVRQGYNTVQMLKDNSKVDFVLTELNRLLDECPASFPMIANEAVKYGWGANSKMEKGVKEYIERRAKAAPKEATKAYRNLTSLYLLNARSWEKAYGALKMAVKYSGDPNYEKDLVLRAERMLGIAPCKDYGKQMPKFNLPDLNGKKVSLDDFKGKYVLIDFWASWCGPCIGELPYLKAAHNEFGPKGLVVLSITFDKDYKSWKKAVKDKGMNWLNISAKGTDVSKQYGVRGIPRIMIIGPDGTLVADELRGELIEKALNKLYK